jgi:hypothetical protein
MNRYVPSTAAAVLLLATSAYAQEPPPLRAAVDGKVVDPAFDVRHRDRLNQSKGCRFGTLLGGRSCAFCPRRRCRDENGKKQAPAPCVSVESAHRDASKLLIH